jgi:hypothetical protein
VSGLRETADRLAKMGALPTPNSDRRLHCEKAALALSDRSTGVRYDKEPWDDFLRRIGVVAQ